MAKNAKDPSVTSEAYDVMQPRWALLDTVLGGTETMRAAGKTLLPMHKGETQDDYNRRLGVTVLENILEQTLEQLSAKPFSEPVQPNDDVPEPIVKDVLPDIDKQGNSLDVFCRRWFRTGLHKGIGGVLVEFPKVQPKEDGSPRTLEDDRRENVRPYWQLIEQSNILCAYGEMIDGQEKLTHVRIMEVVNERRPGEFLESSIPQIRVLEPGLVRLYRKSNARSRKSEWVVHEEWDTGLDVIPMVLFYTGVREDTMLCKPPLLDLAYLNVTHWQSSSDQRNVLTVARFPMLACSGGTKEEGETIKIGPNQLLFNSDPQGKYYYVEHEGAAIEAGRNDLKDLKEAMQGYGAEFLKNKPGDITATARALDGADSLSILQALAIMFRDSVALALDYTAMWMKLDGGVGGTVQLDVDFGVDEAEVDIKPALEMRKNRDISRPRLIDLAKQRGYLPEDFDADANEAELEQELAEAAAAMSDLDPAGGNSPPGSPE